MKILFKALVPVALAVLSAQASASFVGATAGCSTGGPWGTSGGAGFFACNTASAAVASPASEFTLLWFGGAQWSINIEASSLRLDYVGANGFTWGSAPDEGLLDISGLDLSGIVVDSVTSNGIDLFDNNGVVSLISGNLHLDLSSGTAPVFWNPNSWVEIQFSNAGQLPEPTTLALLGAAALAGGLSRRRR